jgi:hypothetical protein
MIIATNSPNKKYFLWPGSCPNVRWYYGNVAVALTLINIVSVQFLMIKQVTYFFAVHINDAIAKTPPSAVSSGITARL